MIPPDLTDVSQESPREICGNLAMTFRGEAAAWQARAEMDGSGGYSWNSLANQFTEWASRLERAVQKLDAEKRGAVPPAEQDTPRLSLPGPGGPTPMSPHEEE